MFPENNSLSFSQCVQETAKSFPARFRKPAGMPLRKEKRRTRRRGRGDRQQVAATESARRRLVDAVSAAMYNRARLMLAVPFALRRKGKGQKGRRFKPSQPPLL